MNINKTNLNLITSGVKTVSEHITPCISSTGKTSVREISTDVLRFTPHKADIVKLSEKLKFEKNLRSSGTPEPVKISLNGEESVWNSFRGSQMGSQDAFWAKNEKNGDLCYIKYAQNEAKEGHIESEILASKLYRLAGIETPEVVPVTIDGKMKGLASKYAADLKPITDKSQVYDGFAADAWLANWDSLLHGNCFVKDGHSFKVDNGGSLRYRAQGKLKPNFGDKVDELTSLVDGRNYTSTSIYSPMSQEDLIKSFEKVCNISDEAISTTVADKELAQTLINRRDYMSNILAEIKETPKTEQNVGDYLTRVIQQAAKKKVYLTPKN